MQKYLSTMLGVLSVLALLTFLGTPAVLAQGPSDDKGGAGFEEFPLGDDHIVPPLVIAGVYFQPVDMLPIGAGGLAAAEADMHLEADISAVEDNG
ncbi:MAG: iron transporter, partial [Deltaproteobacteria bacterium]|nr:iron transporter [Deltaproteobacteria bacterium]